MNNAEYTVHGEQIILMEWFYSEGNGTDTRGTSHHVVFHFSCVEFYSETSKSSVPNIKSQFVFFSADFHGPISVTLTAHQWTQKIKTERKRVCRQLSKS